MREAGYGGGSGGGEPLDVRLHTCSLSFLI